MYYLKKKLWTCLCTFMYGNWHLRVWTSKQKMNASKSWLEQCALRIIIGCPIFIGKIIKIFSYERGKITKYLNPLQTSNVQSGLFNNILRAQRFLNSFSFCCWGPWISNNTYKKGLRFQRLFSIENIQLNSLKNNNIEDFKVLRRERVNRNTINRSTLTRTS